MHVDVVLVGEDKFNRAEHVRWPWGLAEVVRADVGAAPVHLIGVDRTALVVGLQLVLLEHGPARLCAGEESNQVVSRAVAQERQQLLPLYSVGDPPAWMKDDHRHVCRECRRGPIGLTRDDPIGMDGLALPNDSREKLWHVVPDIKFAEVRW